MSVANEAKRLDQTNGGQIKWLWLLSMKKKLGIFRVFSFFFLCFKTFAHLLKKRPYLQNRTFRLYVWTFFRIGKIYRSNGTFYLTLSLIMLNHPWIISLFQLFAQQIYAHLKRQNIRTNRQFFKKDTFLLVSHECCVKKSVDTPR